MIIWSGKPVYFFNSYWVTFHWLQQLNGICRLRYRQRFEVLKLFRVSGFYPWNVTISSNTITFQKLVLNHTDFFRVHIKQDWHFLRIFTRKRRFFQSSHILVLLPNSLHFINQYWQLLSNCTYFSELIYVNAAIFWVINQLYIPLLTNKSIKTFLEFISYQIILTFLEFKQQTFSDRVTTNTEDYFLIICAKQSFGLSLFLLTEIIAWSAFFWVFWT